MIPLGVLASANNPATGGGDVIDPSTVSGLDLWLKGESLTALTPDDPIATWADSSSAGNDATQSSSSARPIYSTATGYPSAYFNGSSNHYLTTPVSASGAAQTVFVAFTVGSATGVKTPVGASATTSLCLDVTNLNPRIRTWGISGEVADTTSPLTVDVVAAAGGRFIDASDSMSLWINATARQDSGVVSSTLTAGRQVRIGIKATSAERHNGHVLEVLHYSAAVSDSDAADIMAYLVDKFGI